MTEPIAFRPRETSAPSTTPSVEPSSAEGFTVTLTMGPFVVGTPMPDWSVVAEQVVAELRREWDAQHA